MLKFFLVISLFSLSVFAQSEIGNLSELQKIYFISETNGLTTNVVNPAALGINKDDDGLMLSYDFFDKLNQGNSLASLSMGNMGFIYQDIKNIDNLRLTSYALNIAVGGDFLSIGSSNKIIDIDYGDRKKSVFTIDAGLTLQPLPFLSIAIVAKNLSNVKIDSLKYDQVYTIGGKINFIKDLLDVFVQTDFKKSTELNTNVQATIGFSLTPVNFFELRTWVIGTKNVIDEGILSAGIKIKNGMIITASAHLLSDKEKTRYNLMLALPLTTISF